MTPGAPSGNLAISVKYPPEETAMWTLLAIAAAASVAFSVIAVGLAVWRDVPLLTNKERTRLP
jgi:hypothetical protein